jgi:signal transduction histidine kinase
MRRISLQRRMIAASAVLALVVGGVFIALILALAALREAREDEARSKEITSEALGLERQVLEVDSGLSIYVITGRAPGSQVLLARYRTSRNELDEKVKSFAKLTAGDPQEQERARGLFALISRYRTDYLDLVTRLAKESIGAAREATRDEGSEQLSHIQEAFDGFLVAEDDRTASREDAADANFTHAVELGVAGLTGSAALILLFAFYLSRSIARPVRDAATGATQLAGGDLSLRLSQSGPGEIGELTTAFNRMAESLQRARVELEEQNAQLRQSERLKSDLVNTVSHELRTPLSGVLGFTKLLLTREFDSETRRHYLGIVDAQARRLSQLIDDFLDVRTIEEGRFDRARDRVDLGTLLRDEATLYSLQSEKHELALDVPDTPLPVMGNADRLRQVIGNLLSNAIKYSPQGGLVEVTASARGAAVRFEVRDEGIGIPTEQQARIFTKFFRADAAASGITGTGLGLAVSRDIVESHGGQIGFMSAEGEGTTFFVELPGADGAAENPLQGDPADWPKERTSR